MKFDTVNQIANAAKKQYSSYVPNWTIDEAAASINWIAENSATKVEAAEKLFEMWEEEGADFAGMEISKAQFVAQLV
jgi:hypothetical protein